MRALLVRSVVVGVVAGMALTALPVRAADLEAAGESFSLFCTKCHGKAGKGDGRSAATLKTKPRDLTDCDRMGQITDETMFKAIKGGGGAAGLSKDMPAWKDGFDDDEIRDLVAYIRTFCAK